MQAPALKPLKSALAELQEQLGTLQDHVVAHCQFQLSVAEVTKPRHQQQLEKLIQFEHEQMESCAERLQAWTKSADLQHLRSSFQLATAGTPPGDGSPGN